MIKFFRKIRQKLLSENKIIKYLIYAIGEILLIVIGIFLALQINNSNSEKLERKEFESILRYVLEDLEKDKTNLQLQQKIRGHTILQTQFVLKTVDEGRTLKSSEILLNLGVLSRISSGKSENGFERLLSDNLYEANEFVEAREKIRTYIGDFDDYLQIEIKTNDFIEEMEIEMFKVGSNLEYMEYLSLWELNNQNPNEVLKTKLEEYKIDFNRMVTNNPPMMAILRRSLVLDEILNLMSKGVIEDGKKVQIEIEKYLK